MQSLTLIRLGTVLNNQRLCRPGLFATARKHGGSVTLPSMLETSTPSINRRRSERDIPIRERDTDIRPLRELKPARSSQRSPEQCGPCGRPGPWVLLSSHGTPRRRHGVPPRAAAGAVPGPARLGHRSRSPPVGRGAPAAPQRVPGQLEPALPSRPVRCDRKAQDLVDRGRAQAPFFERGRDTPTGPPPGRSLKVARSLPDPVTP